MRDYKVRPPSIGLKRREKSLNQDVESLLTENRYQSIQFISVEKLLPFKHQWRSHFDQNKLEDLALTIKEHGIRQPLTVIESEEQAQHFEIVSGERRYKAALIAGLDRVPCIIIHNRDAAEEIALIENVQRTDLHPIELGRAYKNLLDSGLVESQSELSKKIGVPRSQVNEYLRYADLPVAVATLLIEKNIFQRRILRKVLLAKTNEEIYNIIDFKKDPPSKRKILEIYEEDNRIKYSIKRVHDISEDNVATILDKLKEIIKHLQNVNKSHEKLVLIDLEDNVD